jgi:hypothetical protein
MAAVNTPQIDPVGAATQALAKAKQELIAAEQVRADAVAAASALLTRAIDKQQVARDLTPATNAGDIVRAQYVDGVAKAEQNIATVTAQCDKQVERAKKAVKAAGAALHWVLQMKRYSLQNEQKWHASIAAITTISTKSNQEHEMEKLERKQEAEVVALAHNHAKILANDEKTARDRQDAIKAQLDALTEQLKQLELD